MNEERHDSRILELAEKWMNGSISPEEEQEYAQWYNNVAGQELEVDPSFAESFEDHSAYILGKINERKRPLARKVSIKIKMIRIAAAASIVFIIAAGGWLFIKKRTPAPIADITRNDITPGNNKAILTIDNQQIDLSSDKTGITVGNTITYIDGEKITGNGELLTLATPRGGQYQAVLPDGSKVWLNAASSVQFPAVFTGNKRTVTVTGEVYIEVAKDKQKPFIVDVNGHQSVQVLGTSFNINSYADEGSIKTTLIEGSIRINQQAILKPGQQAIQSATAPSVGGADTELKVLNDPDVELATAWKTGIIAFKDTDMKTIMRQVERWYNIDVSFEREIPSRKFTGEIPKDVNLSELLKLFQASKISFVIDKTNKKLIIK